MTHPRHWSPRRRYRFRRTILVALVSATVGLAFQESNIPDALVCDTTTQVCLIPPFASDPVPVASSGRRVHPRYDRDPYNENIPGDTPIARCVRDQESTRKNDNRWHWYPKKKGGGQVYFTAAQMTRSFYDSVSNRAQMRGWPRISKRHIVRAINRGVQVYGLDPWPPATRHCR